MPTGKPTGTASTSSRIEYSLHGNSFCFVPQLTAFSEQARSLRATGNRSPQQRQRPFPQIKEDLQIREIVLVYAADLDTVFGEAGISHAQRRDARDLLVAAALPGRQHALRQRGARVETGPGRGLGTHRKRQR